MVELDRLKFDTPIHRVTKPIDETFVAALDSSEWHFSQNKTSKLFVFRFHNTVNMRKKVSKYLFILNIRV